MQFVLEEQTVLATTDVAQIQSSRSESTHSVDVVSKEVTDGIQRGLHHAIPIVVETASNHGRIDSIRRFHALPNSVMPSALSSDNDVPVVSYRIADDSKLRLAVLVVADRNREVRDVVHEIARAVQRIDDPQFLGVGAIAMGFFRDDCMIRIAVANRFDDHPFGAKISFRNEIGKAFGFDLNRCLKTFPEDLGTVRNSFDRRRQHGMLERSYWWLLVNVQVATLIRSWCRLDISLLRSKHSIVRDLSFDQRCYGSDVRTFEPSCPRIQGIGHALVRCFPSIRRFPYSTTSV